MRLLNTNVDNRVLQRMEGLSLDELEVFIAVLEKAALQINPEDLDENDILNLLDQIDKPKPPSTIDIIKNLSDSDLKSIIGVAPNSADKYLAQAELLMRSGELCEPQTTDKWPIDYSKVYAWRQYELMRYKQDPAYLEQQKAFYGSGVEGCIAFINHWIDTHDPRNAGLFDEKGNRLPVRLPLIMFPRQEEFIRFIFACMAAEAAGLGEKSRDMGATWIALSASVWMWLFWDAVTVGWGSATAVKLDRSGDSGSIFWKLREMVRNLPEVFRPKGLKPKEHLIDKRVYNPDNGSGIVGEVGDEVGRGSRTRIYIVDEAAHFGHPEAVTAALSDTTRVRIDISSVSGLGTVFHRMRQGGVVWEPGQPIIRDRTNVFIMDWRHHPAKTVDWYNTRQAKFQSEGMGHIFAQEVDRDYSAALTGTIIPKKWLEACVDAHLKVGDPEEWEEGSYIGGLDVAGGSEIVDSGIDLNGRVVRKGWVVKKAEDWSDRDPGVTTRRVLNACRDEQTLPIVYYYDSIGVGAAVKAEYNRLQADGEVPEGIKLIGWNAGGKVVHPGKNMIENDKKSPKNKDYFFNLKAQGWWGLRMRVYRTYQAVTEGASIPIDEMISFDSKSIGKILYKLIDEVAQPTAKPNTRMKLVVDKKPEGAKSPNLGDACMQCCFPIPPLASESMQSISKPVLVTVGLQCLECGHRPVVDLGVGRYQCHACGHIGDRYEGTVDYRARGTPPKQITASPQPEAAKTERLPTVSTARYAVGARLLRR